MIGPATFHTSSSDSLASATAHCPTALHSPTIPVFVSLQGEPMGAKQKGRVPSHEAISAPVSAFSGSTLEAQALLGSSEVHSVPAGATVAASEQQWLISSTTPKMPEQMWVVVVVVSVYVVAVTVVTVVVRVTVVSVVVDVKLVVVTVVVEVMVVVVCVIVVAVMVVVVAVLVVVVCVVVVAVVVVVPVTVVVVVVAVVVVVVEVVAVVVVVVEVIEVVVRVVVEVEVVPYRNATNACSVDQILATLSPILAATVCEKAPPFSASPHAIAALAVVMAIKA